MVWQASLIQHLASMLESKKLFNFDIKILQQKSISYISIKVGYVKMIIFNQFRSWTAEQQVFFSTLKVNSQQLQVSTTHFVWWLLDQDWLKNYVMSQSHMVPTSICISPNTALERCAIKNIQAMTGIIIKACFFWYFLYPNHIHVASLLILNNQNCNCINSTSKILFTE